MLGDFIDFERFLIVHIWHNLNVDHCVLIYVF